MAKRTYTRKKKSQSVVPQSVSYPSGGTVRKAQAYIGVEAHGKFDQITIDRLKIWQKKNGLEVTGILDNETKTKMGI